MAQTKLGSLWESLLNVFVGFTIGVISQLLIFPFFGIDIPFRSNLMIAMYFTIIAVARNYVVRRVFNKNE